jgi:tetratricopeptide (TPR) repeat protein
MKIRVTTISRQLALACCLLAPCVTAAVAQEAAPAAQADPVEQSAAAPQRADLTEANELIRDSRYAEADELLATLQGTFPDDPALLLMRGEILLALGRAGDALEPLRRSAEIDADRARVHFQLATALSAMGDAQGALDAFAAEIEHNDDAEIQALALLNRSMLLEQQRMLDEAAAELERLVELQPARAEVYGDLATIYIQAGHVEQAAGALDRGAEAGFLSGQHYYSLGARLYRDKDYEGASRALEKALEIDPAMARAERSLGAALERLDRLDEAVVHLRRYLELAPDAPDADRVAEQIRAAEER